MYGVLALKYCERVPSSAKVHSAPALVHAAPRDLAGITHASCARDTVKTRVKKLHRSRDLCTLSLWEVVLPAPRRRHAAGRERHDLPSYVVFIAHLQSSSQGQRGCWRSPHGHCGHRIEGYGLDHDRPLTSRRAEASQWPRLRQSTGSWFVVEYSS